MHTNSSQWLSSKTRVHTRVPDGWERREEGGGERGEEISSPLEDVILSRSCGNIGCSEVALVESPDLVRLEGTDDGVQEAPVMEQDEVVLLPVVWVHELFL